MNKTPNTKVKKGACIPSERELVSILTKKLSSEGYRVRIEVSNLGQSADMVATKNRWVTLVEVKRRDWRRAITQCRAHEHVADFICIAVACTTPSLEMLEISRSFGYGILIFNEHSKEYSWVLAPKRNKKIWRPQRIVWAKRLSGVPYED